MSIPTARERLENSRRILLRQIGGDDGPRDATRLRGSSAASADTAGAGEAEPLHTASDGPQASPRPRRRQAGAWSLIRDVGGAWWHHHPARMALSLVEPVLGAYGRVHPVRVLGVAAGTGAAIVLLRVWRVLPVTGLLIASLRSSQLPSLAASLVAAGAATFSLTETHDENERQELHP